MPLGREFELQTATIAIDATCVTVKLPARSVVIVIGETSDGRIVHVLCEGEVFAIFAADLEERGIATGISSGEVQAPPEGEDIRKVLTRDVEETKVRRIAAVAHFRDVMAHLPSGIPHPDGTDRIRQASREHTDAIRAETVATMHLNKFLIDGTVPQALTRTPAGKETKGDSSKKTGQG